MSKDFNKMLDYAKSILEDRENTYCNYAEHVNTYSQIITQIRRDLAFGIEVKRECEYLTSVVIGKNLLNPSFGLIIN